MFSFREFVFPESGAIFYNEVKTLEWRSSRATQFTQSRVRQTSGQFFPGSHSRGDLRKPHGGRLNARGHIVCRCKSIFRRGHILPRRKSGSYSLKKSCLFRGIVATDKMKSFDNCIQKNRRNKYRSLTEKRFVNGSNALFSSSMLTPLSH